LPWAAHSRWVDHATIAEEVWGQNDPKAVNRIKYVIYLLRRKLEVKSITAAIDPGA
jgi:DNA-binding response OmpR family regulator